MTCPLCLKSISRSTREHLPFKALYKGLSTNGQDNAAVIKICHSCNQEKSVWDQEFLAVYGDKLEINRAVKAQMSLKKYETIDNSLAFAITATRAANVTKKSIIHYNGVRGDLISQWMWRCGRGIYQYFEKKPFKGNRFNAIPHLIDCNNRAGEFSWECEGVAVHQINDACMISMTRRGDEAPMISVSMVNTKTNRMFSTAATFYETNEQYQSFISRVQSKPNTPTMPLKLSPPRDVFDVSTKPNGGLTYHGVRKVRKNDNNE